MPDLLASITCCIAFSRLSEKPRLSPAQAAKMLTQLPDKLMATFHPFYFALGSFSFFLQSMHGIPSSHNLTQLRLNSERLGLSKEFAEFSFSIERQVLGCGTAIPDIAKHTPRKNTL